VATRRADGARRYGDGGDDAVGAGGGVGGVGGVGGDQRGYGSWRGEDHGGRRGQPRADAERRRRRWWVPLLVLAVLGAGVGVAWHALNKANAPSPQCDVRAADGGELQLEPEQAENAATIGAVGMGRGLPERAVIVALATAMQESKLYNLDYGDRDSLGLFQQRYTMGWGTQQQIMDPVYSSGAFYSALVKVSDYQRMSIADAAQAVQRSADGSAYAAHDSAATLLAGALTGAAPGTLTCVPPPPANALAAQRIGGNGLTPRADSARVELLREFGSASVDAYARDGLGFVVHPSAASGTPSGWAFATWAVAHCGDLNVDQVVYAGKVWSRSHPRSWSSYTGTPPSNGGVLIRVLASS
jgi:hypothetical protein